MHFKKIMVFALGLVSSISLHAADGDLQKARMNWYLSMTETFHFCASVGFQSALCPAISSEPQLAAQQPQGPLTPESLLRATESYREGISPKDWLLSLKLHQRKLKGKTQDREELLVARAKWLLAEVYYDERLFDLADPLMTEVLPYFRGYARFHQERAWVQYSLGKFDRSMGSMMSAESPLVYRLPYTDKYFLRALIERDSCQFTQALSTLAEGRQKLAQADLNVSQVPWVKICRDEKRGVLCDSLVNWASNTLKRQLETAKVDLDFIELELAEKGFRLNAVKEIKPVVWPYVGEKWADEVGQYSVEVPQQCRQN